MSSGKFINKNNWVRFSKSSPLNGLAVFKDLEWKYPRFYYFFYGNIGIQFLLFLLPLSFRRTSCLPPSLLLSLPPFLCNTRSEIFVLKFRSALLITRQQTTRAGGDAPPSPYPPQGPCSTTPTITEAQKYKTFTFIFIHLFPFNLKPLIRSLREPFNAIFFLYIFFLYFHLFLPHRKFAGGFGKVRCDGQRMCVCGGGKGGRLGSGAPYLSQGVARGRQKQR